MANDRIDVLLAPGYLDGLTSMPMDEVRERRARCQAVEVSLSYLRRMVQGRLDIVLAEVRRRHDGSGVGDLHSLVDQLPEILSERVHAPGNGRLSGLMAPAEPEIDGEVMGRLNAIASPDFLSQLPDTAEADIQQLIDRLSTLEREVSDQRKALHERIDALQEEIVRRYKSGEATVDTLLT